MTTARDAGMVEMMMARYPGRCHLCGCHIRVGKEIGYARAAKMTFCRACAADEGKRVGISCERVDEIRAILSAAAPAGPARAARLTTEEREDRGDYSHHFHGR